MTRDQRIANRSTEVLTAAQLAERARRTRVAKRAARYAASAPTPNLAPSCDQHRQQSVTLT